MRLDQVTSRINPNIKFDNGGLLIVGNDSANPTDPVNGSDNGNNGLVGSDFNDMLLGLGGNDTLSGRLGNDWLDAGSGNDTLFGDSGADQMFGGSGDDYLDGGLDSDNMMGGDGNDTYEISSAGDTVVEINPNAVTGGIDVVKTTVDYTLTANVENLILVERSPFSLNDIDGTGNTLDNVITGNSGFNILDGRSGADTMSGGSGDDIYIVDDVGDRVIETDNNNNTRNDGTGYILIDWVDTVRSTISYTLPDFVEHLQLMGGADLNGTGNALDNIIYANTGDNRLAGGANSSIPAFGQNPYETAALAGDTVSYQFGATTGVFVSLAKTGAQDTFGSGVDTVTGFENLIGSPYDDVLTGNAQRNVIGGGGRSAYVWRQHRR